MRSARDVRSWRRKRTTDKHRCATGGPLRARTAAAGGPRTGTGLDGGSAKPSDREQGPRAVGTQLRQEQEGSPVAPVLPQRRSAAPGLLVDIRNPHR